MSLVKSFILEEEIKIVKLPIIIENQLCFNLKEVADTKEKLSRTIIFHD